MNRIDVAPRKLFFRYQAVRFDSRDVEEINEWLYPYAELFYNGGDEWTLVHMQGEHPVNEDSWIMFAAPVIFVVHDEDFNNMFREDR